MPLEREALFFAEKERFGKIVVKTGKKERKFVHIGEKCGIILSLLYATVR